jgi:hypothetical protein
MPRVGNTIDVPIVERDALASLVKVKPTASMRRPEPNPAGRSKRKKRPIKMQA